MFKEQIAMLIVMLSIRYTVGQTSIWRFNNNDNATQLNLWQRFIPEQLAVPLDRIRCRSPFFRHLRTCSMLNNPSQARSLSSITKPYLCQTRDRWTTNNSPTHSISKRSINLCTGGLSKRVITRAQEAARPSVTRELIHDPNNHLYQTMLVEHCEPNFGPVSGLYCRMHKIVFKAAVWSEDPNSNAVEVLDVTTNAYCALA
ncbi:uncharacterized protein LOC100187459 [Ciona intestinalis]